jgi:hypothetical protein
MTTASFIARGTWVATLFYTTARQSASFTQETLRRTGRFPWEKPWPTTCKIALPQYWDFSLDLERREQNLSTLPFIGMPD